MPINPLITDITDHEWEYAQRYFKKKKKETHLALDPQLKHEFICIEGEIYAIKTGQALGEGAFGLVRIVQNRHGQNFAVKIEGIEDLEETLKRYKEEISDLDPDTLAIALKGKKESIEIITAQKKTELSLMKMLGFLKGQGISKFKKAIKFKGKDITAMSYTVQTLHSGKELEDALKGLYTPDEPAELSETQKLILAIKACENIDDLHQKGIIHADIKPANFMSDIQGNNISITSIDFGLSKKLALDSNQSEITLTYGNGAPLVMGTKPYVAPEIDHDGRYSYSSDTYALGYIFLKEFNFKEGTLPKSAEELIKNMNDPDPNKRPPLEDVSFALKAALSKRTDLDDFALDSVVLQRLHEEHRRQFKSSKGMEAFMGALRNLENINGILLDAFTHSGEQGKKMEIIQQLNDLIFDINKMIKTDPRSRKGCLIDMSPASLTKLANDIGNMAEIVKNPEVNKLFKLTKHQDKSLQKGRISLVEQARKAENEIIIPETKKSTKTLFEKIKSFCSSISLFRKKSESMDLTKSFTMYQQRNKNQSKHKFETHHPKGKPKSPSR